MTKKYSRLSDKERIEIYKFIALGKSLSSIAGTLGRNKSTISREVKSAGGDNYFYDNGNSRAVYKSSNRRSGKTKMTQNPVLSLYVQTKLINRWSPQLISVSLRQKFPNLKHMNISHEAIYNYVYVFAKKGLREILISELRQKRKARGNTRRGADKRSTIPDAVSIDERPQEVHGRQFPGHWEGDLVMGKDRASAIGTLVERTTRALIIVPLKAKDSTAVRKAFEKIFKHIPAPMKKSLTYDRGVEMVQHKLLAKNANIHVYFAHPYSPWERPTNENTNGLIRQFFPAGTDFNLVHKDDLMFVQNLLNNRPREVLNYKTPHQAFTDFVNKPII